MYTNYLKFDIINIEGRGGIMKQVKYLIIVLFISSFLFIFDINADYSATVINPLNASCSLKSGSTGYCFYENEELDSFVKGPVWLDTGDIVTVLTNYQTIPTKDTSICSDYYIYVDYYFSLKNSNYKGYYCNANLTTTLLTDELKEEFTNLGFPESYFEKLAILKTAHPNWEFKAVNTKLDFNEAVKSLNIADKSLIQLSSSNNYAYLDTDLASFDYYNNKYIPYDSKSSSNAWYNANYDTIAYYLDPRNFLLDMYIFQFEGLVYDNKLTDEELTNTVGAIFKNDYLSKFTNDFVAAGKESKVSPVYLASLSKQEVGGKEDATSAISGTVPEYEGYYNFYNIGASSGERPVLNGLSFAKVDDESVYRPWNTEYKAIVGGALWIYKNYLSAGQDTSYFKKWNVIYNYLIENNLVEKPYNNYSHQYMTNIMAPSSEARTTYKSYYATGILDSKYTFYIPVFDNMPEVTNLPTKTGWPNNYLSKLIINDKEIVEFDGGTLEYNYYLDINAKKINILATSVSDKAVISGIGEFDLPEIKEDEALKPIPYIIKVTAENGDIKEYKVNIVLTGEIKEESVDVVTTLNNAGIKNGEKYLSGFEIGTDISFIKNKIVNENSNSIVLLKDSAGNEKNSGVLATGDKVIITIDEETKEYEVVIYGDVSGDGNIDALDFIRIKKYMLSQINLTNSNYEAADISKDGNIDALDFIKIKKYMLGTNSSIEQ